METSDSEFRAEEVAFAMAYDVPVGMIEVERNNFNSFQMGFNDSSNGVDCQHHHRGVSARRDLELRVVIL